MRGRGATVPERLPFPPVRRAAKGEGVISISFFDPDCRGLHVYATCECDNFVAMLAHGVRGVLSPHAKKNNRGKR